MQYQYTATNAEGKKLTGVINANSEEEARGQLNNLGFSILELAESAEGTAQSNLEKFEFEAYDPSGKQIKGTVPAKAPILAYKRLIEEYHFNVNYMAPVNAAPEEKQRMRQTGLAELQNQYELQKNQKPEDKSQNTVSETPEFLQEKEALLQKVDNILKEVKTLLAKFETKLSPEKRAEIEGYIDKLSRIKSSNNLEYIRNTSKELLKKVQEDEVFINDVQHDAERKDVIIESQKMLQGLNKSAASKVDFGLRLQTTIQKIEEKLKGSSFAFLLHPLKKIRNLLKQDPEVQQVKIQIKALRTERFDALKIALKSPKETRKEGWATVKSLNAKNKEIRSKLKEIKHRRDDQNLAIKREKHVYFLEEVNTFTGWLLTFYLVYYFLGHYVTTKGLALGPLFGIPFDLSDSALFKYLLALIFLVHGAISLKLNFFLRNKIASIALTSITLILGLLVLFNV